MDSITSILNSQTNTNVNKTDEENQNQILIPIIESAEINNQITEPTTKSVLDLNQAKNLIHHVKDQLDSLLRILSGENVKLLDNLNADIQILNTGERILEGVFNGEKMVGPDGSEYAVPPNYASKSKLVEGDLMKLTITNSGSFLYKQLGPIPRRRTIGELVSHPETNQWGVLAEDKLYKILTASVTFYKGKAGDEVILLTPREGTSDWGAVENIIKK